MRLGILLAVAALVLVTLVTAFPQVVDSRGRSANTDDHMEYTRELAAYGVRLDALEKQQQTLISLPERMARIETRLDTFGWMIFAVLGGVFTLLSKEVWGAVKALNSRRVANGGGG
jgi:hypothetical protein